MKCLILAAGYATRLYPLTENFPKPLLKIGEKTILDWLIDDIDTSAVVDEYIIISNHKYCSHFEAWAASKQQNITVIDDGTSTNETRLGAVKDIQLALEQVQDAPSDGYLIIAGDNVLDFSLKHFIRYAISKQTSCIMRYYESDPERLRHCGIVEIDSSDRIRNMEEKPARPKSNWCCPPFYYYTSDDARLIQQGIDSGCGTDAPGSYIAWLATQVDVHAMEMPGQRYDIGNIDSYNTVQQTYHGIIH